MIYIILPIFNEEATITETVTNIRRVLQGRNYQIIAVNDGSSDGSLDELLSVKKKDIDIVSYKINMNIGAVFSAGIDRALSKAKDNDVIIIMESDRTSSPELIPTLVREIEKKKQDVVIASRYKEKGAYKSFPFMRRVFSFFASTLMRSAFSIKDVRDYTIFFRAYRAKVLKTVTLHFGKFGLIQSKGFVANAELLVKISFFTDKIKEIPFVYDYGKKKGRSKIEILKTINEYFVALLYLKQVEKKVSRIS